MDITTIKILVLAIVALLFLATLAGELRPRRRSARTRVGRMMMVREDAAR
jgi:hypothetical protein